MTEDRAVRMMARLLLRDVVRADLYVTVPEHAEIQRAADGDGVCASVGGAARGAHQGTAKV